MAADGDDGYSCGYCLSEKVEMTDPRKLPCGHIFCFECLLHDYQKSPNIKCICCWKEFENLDVQMLESCSFEKKSPYCDVCSTNSKADIWCITCNKNMCNEHAEAHDSFIKQFGVVHKTEPSSTQSGMPSASGKRHCQIHSKKINGACSKCQCLLCFRCLTDSRCTNILGQSHTVADVHELCCSYKENLNKTMCDLLNKITELDDLEKKAHCLLSEEKTRCDHMKELVDAVLLEQKTLMIEKAEKMKSDIDSHYDGCTSKVLDYVTSLLSTKDQLDHLRKDIHDLKQKTDYDIILQNQEMSDKSAESLANRTIAFSLPVQGIHELEHKENIEKKIEAPSQLKAKIEMLEATMADLQNTKAELKKTKADLEKSEVDLRTAKADLENTKADRKRTKSDLEKAKTDLRKTKSDLEKSGLDLRTAKADLENTKADLKKTKSDLEKANTDLRKTKSDLEKSEMDLKKTNSDVTYESYLDKYRKQRHN